MALTLHRLLIVHFLLTYGTCRWDLILKTISGAKLSRKRETKRMES